MSPTGLMMAAIIIRMHESKTPGEDFALEERKERRRELPCPLTTKLLHAAGSVTNSDWADYAMEILAIALYFPHPVAVKANAVNDFKGSDTRGYMWEKGNPTKDRGGGGRGMHPGFSLSLANNFF